MKRIHILLILLPLFSSSVIRGQIVGANSYLHGTYVEVGVNTCGAYGTPVLPPAGYHPTEGGLGFVADSDMDGWTIGTPDYCGDYFVPGSPVEGWEIQVGANVWTNTDQFCFPFEIAGSVTGYSYAGGVYSTTWEGNITSGTYDIDVTQVTELPEDKLYFLTFVTICNNGGTALTNVYYKRNVDPDQDQPWSGDFTTYNVIESQPPADCEAVVTSEGLTYECFLGMGAIDSMARVSRGNFSTTDGTPAQAWSGTGGYSTSGTSTADLATQITFKIPEILPGDCEDIVFAYILDLDDLSEALAATGDYSIYADTVDITDSTFALKCSNDTIKLEIFGGDNYEWTWSPSAGLDVDTGSVVFAFPDSTTTYIATGYATCDTIIQPITIVVPVDPVANAGPDMSVCRGDTIQLDGSGGATYAWSPPSYLNDVVAEDPLVQAPLTNMFYQLIVYDVNGCSDTDDVAVTLYPDPVIDAGEDEIMMLGGFTVLGASGGTSYVWTPDTWLSDPNVYNPTTFAEDTIMYYVTGTDVNGCENIDSMVVFVLEDMDILSPNAFTPNGDGLNDFYKPIFIGMGEITGYTIYNRWGALLYSGNDLLKGWDGTFNSIPQEVGTYIVYITGENTYGEPITKTLTLALLR